MANTNYNFILHTYGKYKLRICFNAHDKIIPIFTFSIVNVFLTPLKLRKKCIRANDVKNNVHVLQS